MLSVIGKRFQRCFISDYEMAAIDDNQSLVLKTSESAGNYHAH